MHNKNADLSRFERNLKASLRRFEEGSSVAARKDVPTRTPGLTVLLTTSDNKGRQEVRLKVVVSTISKLQAEITARQYARSNAIKVFSLFAIYPETPADAEAVHVKP
jgi:hypothetical protein